MAGLGGPTGGRGYATDGPDSLPAVPALAELHVERGGASESSAPLAAVAASSAAELQCTDRLHC
jgi:hypothetical protein